MVAVGTYDSLESAVKATARVRREHAPDAARRERLDAAYARFLATVDAARGVWAALAE